MRFLATVLLSVFATTAVAQSPAAEKARLRREQARSLLIALSTDARAFHDLRLRARALARIADALWNVDSEQGRVLFRKAWDAAETTDRVTQEKYNEEVVRLTAGMGGSFAVTQPTNVRREVLIIVARRDRTLGEEFLEKLSADKADAVSDPKNNPGRLSESTTQRISVAKDMLANGDTERALQFADPILSTVGMQSIDFLSSLREKDPVAADKRYAALLTASMNNLQADANTVSLLSSYIFTPHLFVVFVNNGGAISSSSSIHKPAEVSSELRHAFFQTAASILLRPLPPPGQDQSSAGVDGKYLVIKRLLPLFEQHAPAEVTEALRTHFNALNTVATEPTRRRDDEWINHGLRPEKPLADREKTLLDRIENAKTSGERDGFYIQLAFLFSNKGDMKAREYASKVEDSEARKRLQEYIDASLAIHHIEKKHAEQALLLARKGELGHLEKAWVLTQSAKIVAKTDREQAQQLVEEAATEARRIEQSVGSRPRALVAVANALKVVDPPRIWEAMFDAVKAANSADVFSGEDGELLLEFRSRSQSSVSNHDVPDFDLDGIFRELSNQDYERAVELARAFEREGPRAVATIAIARAVLESKKK